MPNPQLDRALILYLVEPSQFTEKNEKFPTQERRQGEVEALHTQENVDVDAGTRASGNNKVPEGNGLNTEPKPSDCDAINKDVNSHEDDGTRKGSSDEKSDLEERLGDWWGFGDVAGGK